MTAKIDPFVQALVALCSREGGYQEVADRAHVNAQNLWQILTARPLESGKPRGVGPNLRARLTSAYPHWMEVESGATDHFPQDVIMFAKLMDTVPPELRTRCFGAAVSALVLEVQRSEPIPLPAPPDSVKTSGVKRQFRAVAHKKLPTRSVDPI